MQMYKVLQSVGTDFTDFIKDAHFYHQL